MAFFDEEAGGTYIYPINYPIREYQYDIVKECLSNNTLVCLPTGLGKTFIGAVLMYNFYRWFPSGKVVFMAPTRPLVAQQIEACFNIMGIPQDHTSEMTGSIPPEARSKIWREKKVLFLTPQVLMNDLTNQLCPVKVIKLVVIDEAHKALGNHAYCHVMKILQKQAYNFRVVALSATPGSDIQAIQQVISNLLISHIELRSEDSPDILPYTFARNIDKIVIPIEGELKKIKEHYMDVVRYYINKLIQKGLLFSKNENSVSKFQLLKAREVFRQSPPVNCDRHTVGMLEGTFALCITLYHALELLTMHGIRSFYNFLRSSLDEKKGSFYGRGELSKNTLFMKLMESLKKDYKPSYVSAIQDTVPSTSLEANVSFLNHVTKRFSHPKMEKLQGILLKHFNHFKEINESTRVMVFSQYRDSVYEISSLLESFQPLIKPMAFFGQSLKGGRGNTQKEQIRVIKHFKSGNYNTLVSTCVGEEGLDIGEVDLIVCYDAPRSPIRLVQRMGRTGRKRDGRIVVLVTEGKEDQSYLHSQYQRKSLIADVRKGDKLARHFYQYSPRIIPEGINPECLKLKMQVKEYEHSTSKSKRSKKKEEPRVKEPLSYMTETQRKLYEEKYRMDLNSVIKIQKPSLMDLKTEFEGGLQDDCDGRPVIDFSEYQPWYTTLQEFVNISHSKATQNLVSLTEFINLQHVLGDNDNYALEMAPFMKDVYFQNEDTIHEKTVLVKARTSTNGTPSKINEKSSTKERKKCSIKSKKNKWGKISKASKIKADNKGIRSFLIDLNVSNPVNKKQDEDKMENIDLVNKPNFDIGIQDFQDITIDEDIQFIHDSRLNGALSNVFNENNGNGEFGVQTGDSIFGNIEDIFKSYEPHRRKDNIDFLSPPQYGKCSSSQYYNHSFVSNMILNCRKEEREAKIEKFQSVFDHNCNVIDIFHEGNSSFSDSSVAVENKVLKKSYLMSEKVSSSNKQSSQIIVFKKLNDDSILHHKTITNVESENNDNSIEFITKNKSVSDPVLCDNEERHLVASSPIFIKNASNLPSVLLTPPHANDGVMEKERVLSVSPTFVSKRPSWVEDSSFIYSSTPIANKAKKFLGNSSINITPISLSSRGKIQSIVQKRNHPLNQKQTYSTSPDIKNSSIVNPNNIPKNKNNDNKNVVKENCSIMPLNKEKSNSYSVFYSNTKISEPQKDELSVANFDLFDDDDDLFANIDLQQIEKEASKNFASHSIEHQSDCSRNLVNNKKNETISHENSIDKGQSLMSLTQVINFVNGPSPIHLVHMVVNGPSPRSSSRSIHQVSKSDTHERNMSQSSSKFVKNLSNEFRKQDNDLCIPKVNSGNKFPEPFTDTDGNKYPEASVNTKNSIVTTNKELTQEKSKALNNSLHVIALSTNKLVDAKDTLVHFDFGLDGFDGFCNEDKNPINNQEERTCAETDKCNLLNISEDMFSDGEGFTKSMKSPIQTNLPTKAKMYHHPHFTSIFNTTAKQLKSNSVDPKDFKPGYNSSSSVLEPNTKNELVKPVSKLKETNKASSILEINDLKVKISENTLKNRHYVTTFKNSHSKINPSFNEITYNINVEHQITENDMNKNLITKSSNLGVASTALESYQLGSSDMSLHYSTKSKVEQELQIQDKDKDGFSTSQRISVKPNCYMTSKPNAYENIFSSPEINTKNADIMGLIKNKEKSSTKLSDLNDIFKKIDKNVAMLSELQHSQKPCSILPNISYLSSQFSHKKTSQPSNRLSCTQTFSDNQTKRKAEYTDSLDSSINRTKNITSTQDSPIIRKAKNNIRVVDSDKDESLKDITNKKLTKGINKFNSCTKASDDYINISDSDDDFDIPHRKSVLSYAEGNDTIKNASSATIKTKKKGKNSKAKKDQLALIHMEADMADDSVIKISSDESESSLDDYDSSFVDDEHPATQVGIDMKAVYLRSVRSPEVKPPDKGFKRPNLQRVFSQTISDEDLEEEEDSFVVANDFVEYDTQYMGDSMLAVDTIMNEAALNKFKPKKNSKRKRIVQLEDSSDEDVIMSPKKSKLNPVFEGTSSSSVSKIDVPVFDIFIDDDDDFMLSIKTKSNKDENKNDNWHEFNLTKQRNMDYTKSSNNEMTYSKRVEKSPKFLSRRKLSQKSSTDNTSNASYNSKLLNKNNVSFNTEDFSQSYAQSGDLNNIKSHLKKPVLTKTSRGVVFKNIRQKSNLALHPKRKKRYIPEVTIDSSPSSSSEFI